MSFCLLLSQLFPLTGDSDLITHFLGVLVDLPLSVAERDALLQHINAATASLTQQQSVARQQPPTQQPPQPQAQQIPIYASSHQQQQQMVSAQSQMLDPRVTSRSQGEMLFQRQQNQFHMHQERIRQAQMEQVYFSLSSASQQDLHTGVGGGFDDLGCTSVHSLCLPDDAMGIQPQDGNSGMMPVNGDPSGSVYGNSMSSVGGQNSAVEPSAVNIGAHGDGGYPMDSSQTALMDGNSNSEQVRWYSQGSGNV
jgi:hypothetical protein